MQLTLLTRRLTMLVLVLLVGPSFSASANSRLGASSEWAVFVDAEAKTKACWAVTSSVEGHLLFASRFRGIREPEVSVEFSKRPARSTSLKLVIGAKAFRMKALTRGGGFYAWLSSDDDAKVISALRAFEANGRKNGQPIILKQGEKSLAEFSPVGFSEMHKIAISECRKP